MAFLALTRLAIQDLREIAIYSTEQWGEKVASEYLATIEQALARLKDHPELLRSKADVSDCLKFYRVGRHFLVCAVDSDFVCVLTIKHGVMDLPERIAELEPSLLAEAAILHQRFRQRRGS